MALRVRYQYQSGSSLGYSIERLSDGLYYDFATTGPTAGTFTASPATQIATLLEDSGNFLGRFKATLSSTPAAKFTDGGYCVTVHNLAASNTVVGELSVEMHSGDDAPVFPVAAAGAILGDPPARWLRDRDGGARSSAGSSTRRCRAGRSTRAAPSPASRRR